MQDYKNRRRGVLIRLYWRLMQRVEARLEKASELHYVKVKGRY